LRIHFLHSISSFLLLITFAGCAVHPFPKQSANVTLQDAHLFGTVVAFNTNSTLLASGDQNGLILLSSLPKGSPIANFKAHDDYVTGIGFLREGEFVSTGEDKRIVVWDTTGKMLREIRTPSPITQMVLSIKDRIIITGHTDGSVRIWKLPQLEPGGHHPLHKGKVLSVAYDEVNQRLASSGNDGRVFVWNAGQEPRELNEGPGKIASLLFSSDGRILFGGAWFDLYRWDVANGKVWIFPTEHNGVIHRLRYAGDDNTLATISRHTDGAVYFLNSQNGAAVRRFQSHELCGADIAVSPDGCYLATTSDDSSVRIWYLPCKTRTN
jgi:WD40 repeat protein